MRREAPIVQNEADWLTLLLDSSAARIILIELLGGKPLSKGVPMAKNIFVGNLVWDATSDDLLALFQEYGAVAETQVISDRETGRSRGFGFVKMTNDGEAQKAIDALNGFDFKGRALTVNESRPRDDRGGGRRS